MVLAVSIDAPKNKATVESVARAFHVPASMLSEMKDGGWGEPAYIPTTYVIDPNGIVQAKLLPDVLPVTVGNLTNLLKTFEVPPEKKPDSNSNINIAPEKKDK